MGSVAAAGLIAQAAFFGLLLVGVVSGELSLWRTAVFGLLWLGAFIGVRWLPYWLPFSSCVAILDIVLAFHVLKGDVKLS
jgi:hypothetical protein